MVFLSVFKTICITLGEEKKVTSKKWDDLWQDKETLSRWSNPDHDVAMLIPRLKQENIKRVLDLGFGAGRHVILFAKEGFDVYGIEESNSGVDHCREWLDAENLQASISQGDMSTIPYPDSFFDFVLSWKVIHHATLEKIKITLKEILRVTHDNGLFYLTLNNMRSKNYGKGTEIEPGTFLNPEKTDGGHLHHYSDEKGVRELLKDWQIVDIREEGDKHSPYSGQWIILVRKGIF
jgi:ubiquinone/menaquinone biosynthesis C-methylase UbiE